MKSHNNMASMAVLICMMCPGITQADSLKSELEINADYIQSLVTNPEINLNRILRGITGLEINIYFRTNSAELDLRSREQIANVAKVMWTYPMVSATISGHTDSHGTTAYNKKLSQKRIDVVHDLLRSLLSHNYQPGRFNTHAYGESFDPHGNSDNEGMAFDRRVSILLLVPVK